jgi:hypothetical protein
MAVEVLNGPAGRNVDELRRQIKAKQAVAANPGKAAPAGSKPGDELITTSKENIAGTRLSGLGPKLVTDGSLPWRKGPVTGVSTAGSSEAAGGLASDPARARRSAAL